MSLSLIPKRLRAVAVASFILNACGAAAMPIGMNANGPAGEELYFDFGLLAPAAGNNPFQPIVDFTPANVFVHAEVPWSVEGLGDRRRVRLTPGALRGLGLGEEAPLERYVEIANALQPVGGAATTPGEQSVDAEALTAVIADTAELSARQAELMLDMRHALLSTYDAVSDLRGTWTDIRSTFTPDWGSNVFVGNTPSSPTYGNRPSVQSGDPSPNRILRFVSAVIVAIQDYYWVVLAVGLPGMLVAQVMRR